MISEARLSAAGVDNNLVAGSNMLARLLLYKPPPWQSHVVNDNNNNNNRVLQSFKLPSGGGVN